MVFDNAQPLAKQAVLELQQATKNSILTILELVESLQNKDIREIKFDYWGKDDEGEIEGCWVSEGEGNLTDAEREKLESAIYFLLPGNWQFDEGSAGTATLNLTTLELSFEHNLLRYIRATEPNIQIGECDRLDDIKEGVLVDSDFHARSNEQVDALPVKEEKLVPQPFGYAAIDLSRLVPSSDNERYYSVLPEEKPHTYCHLKSVASQVAKAIHDNGDTYKTIAVFELHPVALEELDPLVQSELNAIRRSRTNERLPLIERTPTNCFAI